MIYILNDKIEYNSDSNEVLKVDSGERITSFTPILNHIFRTLIENNKKIISREALLVSATNDYGINTSMNTLNQYISVLRKFFLQHLKIESSILSIPNQGVILSSEIIIKEKIIKESPLIVKTHEEQAGNDTIDNAILDVKYSIVHNSTNLNNNLSVTEIDKKPKIVKDIILISIIFCMVILGFFYIFNLIVNSSEYDEVETFEISHIESCPVYGFREVTDNENTLAIIEEHLSFYNIKCLGGDEFYYYDNYDSSSNRNQSLLSQCKKNKSCISTRINKWSQ